MLTSASQIRGIPAIPAIQWAAAALRRDIDCTCTPNAAEGTDIILLNADMPPEQYRICLEADELRLYAGDPLGFVYGLYRISHDILGVEPFWFWNDQPLKKAAGHAIPDDWCAESKPCAVWYRG